MEQKIWKYQDRTYKVYVEDYGLKRKIERWKEFKLCCQYSHVNGNGTNGWDFIFPAKKYNKVAKLLGISSN